MSSTKSEKSESDDESSDPSNAGWRRLPTAWIHFFWVELASVWLAVFSWLSLVIGATTKVYMMNRSLEDPVAQIHQHFWDKYMFGHVAQQNITFNHGQPVLDLHESTVHGFGIAWRIVAWSLPVGACILVAHSVWLLAKACLWSFEEGLYLRFTWDLPRTMGYKLGVAIMVGSPFLLLLVWFAGAHLYAKKGYNSLDDNFEVMTSSLLKIVLLLFALNMLAYPNVPAHDWQRKDMCQLRFRRSLFHLLFSRNASLGLKLADALWTAQSEHDERGQLSERSRLRRYFWSLEEAERAFRLLRGMQRAEARAMASPPPARAADAPGGRGDEGL